MHICLDIDDTITYAPEFFASLCDCFSEAAITIVTFRFDRESTEKYLQSVNVRYDRLIVSSDETYGKQTGQSLHQWKADLVNQLKPDLFFEDMPEVVSLIDPAIKVFMPCDEVIRGWIHSAL